MTALPANNLKRQRLRPHRQRYEDSILADRSRQLFKLRLVKRLARIVRRHKQVVDRELAYLNFYNSGDGSSHFAPPCCLAAVAGVAVHQSLSQEPSHCALSTVGKDSGQQCVYSTYFPFGVVQTHSFKPIEARSISQGSSDRIQAKSPPSSPQRKQTR